MSRENSGSMFARLSTKIFLAMSSVLFLFAIVLCLYFYLVMIPQNSVRQSSPQNALIAEQMRAALLEAQKNENLFLLHPDTHPLSEYKAVVIQLNLLTNQFAQSAQQTGNDKNVTTASKITNSIQKMASTFLDLVQAQEAKGFNNSTGLLKKLDNTGQQLQEVISRNEAGSLALALLRIQRHDQEYIKSNNNIDLQNLQTAIKNFSRLLMDTRIDPVEAQILRKGIREYNSGLDRYQAVSLATNDRSLSTTLGKERQRQAEAMHNTADNLGSVINRINIPDALPMVLVIQQHVTDYLLTENEKYIQQVNVALEALIKTFNSSSILQEHKEQVLKTSIMYRNAFTALVQQNKVIKDHLTNLNEKTSSLETLINTIIKSPPKSTSGKVSPLSYSENKLAMIAAIAGIAVILIGFLVAIILGKSISAPIINMTDTVHRITTEHDFNQEIPINSNNEIGMLAQELNTLLHLQKTSLSQANSLTSGQTTDELILVTEIAHDLQRQISNAIEANSKISSSAKRQNELADDVNNSISQISASANAINDVFNKSDEQKQLISVAVEGIKAITPSSSQISEIIALSTDVAEKTNLLALNASVKAARAGSHGKEFAVIADEIAKLAQRSEQIAKEASQLTANLNGNVDESIKLGDKSNESLDQVQDESNLNLLKAEELANQVAVIITNASELDNLSKSFTATINEIDSTAKEQEFECTTALESIETLLNKTSTINVYSEEEKDINDATLKQGVDNIQIKLSDQEESNESSIEITDSSEVETTETEQGNDKGTFDKEFENVDTKKNDNSEGTLT